MAKKKKKNDPSRGGRALFPPTPPPPQLPPQGTGDRKNSSNSNNGSTAVDDRILPSLPPPTSFLMDDYHHYHYHSGSTDKNVYMIGRWNINKQRRRRHRQQQHRQSSLEHVVGPPSPQPISLLENDNDNDVSDGTTNNNNNNIVVMINTPLASQSNKEIFFERLHREIGIPMMMTMMTQPQSSWSNVNDGSQRRYRRLPKNSTSNEMEVNGSRSNYHKQQQHHDHLMVNGRLVSVRGKNKRKRKDDWIGKARTENRGGISDDGNSNITATIPITNNMRNSNNDNNNINSTNNHRSSVQRRIVMGINHCTRTLERLLLTVNNKRTGTDKTRRIIHCTGPNNNDDDDDTVGNDGSYGPNNNNEKTYSFSQPPPTTTTTTTILRRRPSLIVITNDVNPPTMVAHIPYLAKVLAIPILLLPGNNSSIELGKILQMKRTSIIMFLPSSTSSTSNSFVPPIIQQVETPDDGCAVIKTTTSVGVPIIRQPHPSTTSSLLSRIDNDMGDNNNNNNNVTTTTTTDKDDDERIDSFIEFVCDNLIGT